MTHTEKDDLVERLMAFANCEANELEDMLNEAAARITELEGKLREIYEVYAGSEGLPCETASEAYLVRLIKQMADVAALKTQEPT